MSQPNVPPPSKPRTTDGAGQHPGAPQSGDANATAVIDDLEALRARAQSAEQERDQFLALLQRTRADFENYQKRMQRDLAEERRYWHKPLASELLPVLDNLQRATAAAKQAGESGPLVQGVALVEGQILDLFKRHGIRPIDALHKPFDPNLHQAVMQQPSAEHPPGTVLQVLEQGFMIHDRVLRPASVVVSRAPER
jgi:molecular chaperone GrpE